MIEKINVVENARIKSHSFTGLDKLLDDIAAQITGDTINLSSHFSFIWNKIHFSGQILKTDGQSHLSINLVANLGYIPYSAEDKSHRKKLYEIFTPLFMKGDFILTANSQIQMVLITDIAGPINAKKFLEAIIFTLLDLKEKLKSLQKQITR